MRCKCCNRPMTVFEYSASQTDECYVEEDMCYDCLGHVWNHEYDTDHEFQFESIEILDQESEIY